MSGFISALTDSTTGITASTYWQSLTDMVPYLLITIPVAIGYYLIRRAIKKSTKLKAGV